MEEWREGKHEGGRKRNRWEKKGDTQTGSNTKSNRETGIYLIIFGVVVASDSSLKWANIFYQGNKFPKRMSIRKLANKSTPLVTDKDRSKDRARNAETERRREWDCDYLKG